MVLQVVQKNIVIVSGIETEDDQARDTNRDDEGEDRPDRARDGHGDQGRQADERRVIRVMPRVTSPRDRRRAVQHPAVERVLDEAPGDECDDHRHACDHDGPGEATDPGNQKNETAYHIARQHQPVIGRAVDHPLHSGEQDVSGSSRSRFSH